MRYSVGCVLGCVNHMPCIHTYSVGCVRVRVTALLVRCGIPTKHRLTLALNAGDRLTRAGGSGHLG